MKMGWGRGGNAEGLAPARTAECLQSKEMMIDDEAGMYRGGGG